LISNLRLMLDYFLSISAESCTHYKLKHVQHNTTGHSHSHHLIVYITYPVDHNLVGYIKPNKIYRVSIQSSVKCRVLLVIYFSYCELSIVLPQATYIQNWHFGIHYDSSFIGTAYTELKIAIVLGFSSKSVVISCTEY